MSASSTHINNSTKTLNSRIASAAVGMAFVDQVPKKRDVSFFEADAKTPESSSPDGDKFTKARAFWARKELLRKSPHHCGRCAKPHIGEGKQCPACKAYAVKYRAKRRNADMPAVEPKTIAALEKRIANLEHYFARLSTQGRVEYKKGYCAGRRLHRKSAERARYYDAMPRAAAQELAQISHEYAR
jgi:hypothetical protein